MNVGMIGQKGIPVQSGGVEKHVEILSRLLVEDGYELTVYNRSGYADKSLKEYKGIKLVTIPTLNIKGIEAVIYSFLASFKAAFSQHEVVHYHALGPSTMLWIPKLRKKKIVVTIHGLDWQRKKWGKFARKFLQLGERICVKYADEIVVVGKHLVEYFRNEYNREVTYIPNGIEDMSVTSDEVLKTFDIEDKGYLLFLARIVPEKGCHYLLDAYSQIRNPKMKLVIAGGSSQTDKYYDELINEYNSNKNIIFTGEVRGNEVNELYTHAKSYILPSDIEGLPISLLEALSCGILCVVSNIEENMNVIEADGKYGYSFEAANIGDLKVKLEKVMSGQVALDLVSVKKEILDKYNWNKVESDLVKIYKSL